nr:hypothetical protein [Halomonas sp.]
MRAGGLFRFLVVAQSLRQRFSQAITVHPIPGLGGHALPSLLKHPQGNQLTPGSSLLLGAHARLGFPAVMRAFLFLPKPPFSALCRWRVAQKQRLGQEDGALHVDTRQLGEHRLIGNRTAQQGREHGGSDVAHATPPPI